jgi:hypothetical protein
MDAQKNTFGVKEFIRYIVGNSPHFAQNFDGIERAQRIIDSLEKLTFNEGDWDVLCAASKNPMVSYPITPAYVCAPLIRCVIEAKNVPNE